MARNTCVFFVARNEEAAEFVDVYFLVVYGVVNIVYFPPECGETIGGKPPFKFIHVHPAVGCMEKLDERGVR